jgi:hypothetical protein
MKGVLETLGSHLSDDHERGTKKTSFASPDGWA